MDLINCHSEIYTHGGEGHRIIWANHFSKRSEPFVYVCAKLTKFNINLIIVKP